MKKLINYIRWKLINLLAEKGKYITRAEYDELMKNFA